MLSDEKQRKGIEQSQNIHFFEGSRWSEFQKNDGDLCHVQFKRIFWKCRFLFLCIAFRYTLIACLKRYIEFFMHDANIKIRVFRSIFCVHIKKRKIRRLIDIAFKNETIYVTLWFTCLPHTRKEREKETLKKKSECTIARATEWLIIIEVMKIFNFSSNARGNNKEIRKFQMTASTYKLPVLWSRLWEEEEENKLLSSIVQSHPADAHYLRISTDSPINYAQLSERAFNFLVQFSAPIFGCHCQLNTLILICINESNLIIWRDGITRTYASDKANFTAFSWWILSF